MTIKPSLLHRVLLLLGVAFGSFFLTLPARAMARWATLEAIHHLENPRDLTRAGPCGELGAFQFREATWRMHTTEPFARAIERSVSDEVAVRHYEWLRRGLEQNGLAASPYNIALAWNGGLRAAVRGRAPRMAHVYAERACNLAEEFERTRLLASR